MHRVEPLLLDIFGRNDWALEKPNMGVRKECYFATAGNQKVFMKFDTGSVGLERLGEVGVAPRLLAHGVYEGQTYVVQEFLEGKHPDRAWPGSHAGDAGEVFARYHGDAPLLSLLDSDPDASIGPERFLRREVESLRMRMDVLGDTESISEPVVEGMSRFLAMSEVLTPMAFVPTHDEPNTSNMLVHSGRLVLVDWDDIGLRDPLHDLGPYLWWYVPQGRWEELLVITRLELTGDVQQRVYWFAARASLNIGLWHLEHGYGTDRGYLEDFLAAVNLRPNPRAPRLV
jgi:aminoglycoside phosphotransferase (APT) family kinase protein